MQGPLFEDSKSRASRTVWAFVSTGPLACMVLDEYSLGSGADPVSGEVFGGSMC